MAAEDYHHPIEDPIEAHVVEVTLCEEVERKPMRHIRYQLRCIALGVKESLTYPPDPLNLESSRAVLCGRKGLVADPIACRLKFKKCS